MDKFVVSARKYRPQLFDTVVGQEHITTTLKNAITQNHLAHAFLFCGPRGVGKTTCARILAKTINCESKTQDGEACNVCTSCVSFNNGSSLNIYELDAASNNSVDNMRELTEQVRFAPQAGEYKVYIIDEVHMLSAAAFNAFLKTLEEPPPHAIFILATTEKHKILPTILSRCQIFDFKRITTNDTVTHLQNICDKEHVKADTAALQVIAQKSEGCMRDALSIMDKIVSFTNGELEYSNTLEHLNILDEDYYFQLLDCMMQQDAATALLLFDGINRKGFEGDTVLNGFAGFIRNVLVSKDAKVAELLDTVESFKTRYQQTAATIPTSLLISTLNILSEAEINYRAAKNKKLHVELTLIKLCYLMQALQVTTNGDELIKKKIADKPVKLAFRTIAPMALKTKVSKPPVIQDAPAPETEARLTIEMPQPQIKTAAATPATNEATIPKKISSLEQLRNKFKASKPQEDLPIQQEALESAWKEFIEYLKETKNAAAQSFDLSTLKVVDDNSFEVYTTNTIQYRFIDTTKTAASEFLQEKLSNRQLQFFIIREEGNEPVLDESNMPLTALQQYQKLVEKNPLIQELKEKLNLELER